MKRRGFSAGSTNKFNICTSLYWRDAIVANIRRVGFIQIVLLVFCMLSTSWNGRAQETSSLLMMPLPAHVEQGEGEFRIDGDFGIALMGFTEPRMEQARQRFLDTLSRETGIPLWREAVINHPRFTIRTAGPGMAVQQLGEDESYRLV